MKHQNVIFTNSVGDALNKAVEQLSPRNVFVLTDENVERESLTSFRLHSEWQKLSSPAGDINKTLTAHKPFGMRCRKVAPPANLCLSTSEEA